MDSAILSPDQESLSFSETRLLSFCGEALEMDSKLKTSTSYWCSDRDWSHARTKPVSISFQQFILIILFGWNYLILFLLESTKRNSKLTEGHRFRIMQGAIMKLMLREIIEGSKRMCIEECRNDCVCFMTIYRKKKCQLFKKEAQYYFWIALGP